MERYSLVSAKHAYDSVSNKLVDVQSIQGETVSVPQFLWSASALRSELPGSSVGREIFHSDSLGVVCKKADALKLKDFIVTVAANQKHVWRNVAVRSTKKNQFRVTSMSARVAFTQQVELKREVGGYVREWNYAHATSVPSVYRVPADGLVFRNTLAFQNNHLPYGLVPEQFGFWYRGRLLNGRSYVLFCGNVIILLGDDFSFDSFALWSGKTDNNELIVELFAYSVNTYIIKMMTLA